MRTNWCKERENHTTPTQLYYAKQGIITPEMEFVARKSQRAKSSSQQT